VIDTGSVCRSLQFLVLLGVAPLAFALSPARFVERAVPSHAYTGGWHHFVGGGVAAFDCDGDHFPELFIAGGESPATLWHNRTGERGGVLRFEASTPSALSLTAVTGAYPLDIDSDGLLDLVVLRAGPDALLRGLGDCRFEAASDGLGFESPDLWSTAFSATFEAGNALPTLAVGTYVDRAHPDGPFGQCSDTLLYRPEAGRYGAPEALSPGFCALSMLFTDWSRSGRADLRVSNDRHYYVRGGAEQLWAMEEVPRLYQETEGWQRYQLWGGDGRPSTGWHAAFGDAQNDGLDDLFIAKGNVDQMPDAALKGPNNLLLQTGDGQFVESGAEAGVASLARGRGAAFVDFNRDGLLDLAVVNRRAPVEVYENRSAGGAWLEVQLAQSGLNPAAVGAYVEVRNGERIWTREVTIGGGHASGDASPLHFGLGRAESVEMRVIWPDQQASTWHRVASRQSVRVERAEPDGLVLTDY